jgi:hypothetical protein
MDPLHCFANGPPALISLLPLTPFLIYGRPAAECVIEEVRLAIGVTGREGSAVFLSRRQGTA